MLNDGNHRGVAPGSLLFGLLLVMLGLFFLLAQTLDLFFGLRLGRFAWPLGSSRTRGITRCLRVRNGAPLRDLII